MKTFAPYLRVLAGMFAGICLWLAFAEVVNGNIAQAVTQLLFAAGLGYLAVAKPIRDHQARVKVERDALAARADAENAEFLAGDPAAFAPPPEEPEKPKMRRGVVTATVIAGAVVLVGIVNDIATGLNDPTQRSKTAATTTQSAPTAGVATPPVPPPTASQAPASPSNDQIAAEARQLVANEVLMGEPDLGNFINSDIAWAQPITKLTFESGVLRVFMQVNRESVDGQHLGDRAANGIALYIEGAGSPRLRDKVDWVETVDGVGDHIAQYEVLHRVR